MEQEDPEALRRRLYRPGASAADLASYLHVAAAQTVVDADEAPLPEPEPSPSLRPFAVGASVVAAAAVLGGLLLSGVLTPPTASPTAAVATTAAHDDPRTVWFTAATVLDGGADARAGGTSVQEGPDRYRYTVADGDTAGGVAARFGVCTGDVLVALPYGVDPGRLPAGLTIELAKLTSTTC